jgi:phosphoenolpyruvate synthase/pyruvate phosphate dikinase
MNYVNYVSREMSITSIYYPFVVQTEKIVFNYNARKTFYFSNKGYIKGYKSVSEIDNIVNEIKKHVKKNNLRKILLTFIELRKKIEKEYNLFINLDLNKISKKKLILLLKKFHKLYLKYWSYHLFGFHLGHAYLLTDSELFDEKKLIVKIRKYHPYNFFDEKYLPHLFNYINKNYKIDKKLLFNLSLPEVIFSLENDLFEVNKLYEREKGFLLMKKENIVLKYSGEKAYDFYNKIIKEKSFNLNEIKGIVAYPGKVKGKTKIIILKKDQIKFKKKDILVASQTLPDLIFIMKKASAIVTDEGGLTCHAAIVSRELKIPCIIGTKIATKVFKDNDLVEVDANKGIVRKIK